MIVDNKENKILFHTSEEQISLVKELLENNEMICIDINSRGRLGRIDTSVNGLKVEYQIENKCLRVGYGAGKENLSQIYDVLLENYDKDEVKMKPNWINVYRYGAEEFENFLDILEDIEFEKDLEIPFDKSVKSKIEKGVSFEGTLLSRTKERGASIQAATSSMICAASGMDTKMLFAEQYFECGQIDGVEYNQDKTVKSIFEVQSGIFNGDYLDANHRDKALGRYLYDPEIISTVEKVVIWAGGYYESDLIFFKERAVELSRRDNPIEIVLLKTIKTNDVYGIGVERVNL